MTIKEIRALTGLSQQKFADKYLRGKKRTIQNWEYDITECPDYLVDLLEFRVKYDLGLLP